MSQKTFHYSNEEITVVWKPEICIHSGICFRGLPAVFDPRRKPWVDIKASGTHEIKTQVSQCPSGALSFFINEERAGPESFE
jgi:uncharacterized Fe-S cluster protein YjdI